MIGTSRSGRGGRAGGGVQLETVSTTTIPETRYLVGENTTGICESNGRTGRPSSWYRASVAGKDRLATGVTGQSGKTQTRLHGSAEGT